MFGNKIRNLSTTVFEPHEPRVKPPRWLMNKYVFWSGLLLILVPFFLPIPIELKRHPLISPLGDQLHTIFLGALTFMLYWKGPLRGRIGLTVLAAAISGAAIEFIQLSVGRMPLVHDFILDMIGIGIVFGFLYWRGYKSKYGFVLMLLLMLCVPLQLRLLPARVAAANNVRKQFPVIVDFEGRHDNALLTKRHGAVATISDRPNRNGGETQNRTLLLTTDRHVFWPGVTVGLFPYDWSDYQTLEMDVRNRTTGTDSIRFGLRLDDFDGITDGLWVEQPYYATNEWQTVRFSFQNRRVRHGERLFNAADVYQILVYFSRPKMTKTIEIDNLRLR